MATASLLHRKLTFKTPLITYVIKKYVDEKKGVYYFHPSRDWEFVGKNLPISLMQPLNNAFRYEVEKILKVPEVDNFFPHLSAKFWCRLALPISEFSKYIMSSHEVLGEFIKDAEENAKLTAKLIKKSELEKIDDLIFGLSALVDHDRWLAEKIRLTRVDDLAQKLSARAFETTLSFIQFSNDLAFAWIASTSAALSIVSEYRSKNMNYLAWLCQELADKLDAYMETLDMVVDDELYEDLVRLGIVERSE